MGTIQNGGQRRHDGQKNFAHSNQRNPDHSRDNTRDKQYKDFDTELTNDANYDINGHIVKGSTNIEDTRDNAGEENTSNY